MTKEYGVLVDGVFEARETVEIRAKGFTSPMLGRAGTYDQYVMKEINRSYGQLDVEGRVVLDIGANIGGFTCWALQRKAMHLISLEPETNNFDMLSLNTSWYATNPAREEPFTLYRAALTSSHDGPMELYLSPTGKNPGNSSTTFRRGRAVTKINAISVAKLKENHPIIDVAKIDCEGAEYEFIEALIDAYPRLMQVALEIHINGFGIDKATKLHHFMLERNFFAKVPPRIQDNLWQTLATYEKV